MFHAVRAVDCQPVDVRHAARRTCGLGADGDESTGRHAATATKDRSRRRRRQPTPPKAAPREPVHQAATSKPLPVVQPHGPTHAQKPPATATKPAAKQPATPAVAAPAVPTPAQEPPKAGGTAGQGVGHRHARAAFRVIALRRSEPARRAGHALSDRVGLQTPRPAGGDRPGIRGLASSERPGRDQGLGAPGHPHRATQLHCVGP